MAKRGLASAVFATMAAVAVMFVLAAPAAAKFTHGLEGTFEGAETPPGSFGILVAAAVDNSSGPSAGDLYVGGTTELNAESPGVIYKLKPDGSYAGVEITGSETPQGALGMFNAETYQPSRGLAIDGSSGANAGDVYVADLVHGVVDRFGEDGKFLCQITGKAPAARDAAEESAECNGAAGSEVPGGSFSPDGVAVDPVNGDVYVSDLSHAVVDEFNAAGAYIGQISSPHLTQPATLAFNSVGELYVDNGSLFVPENVVKFDASGAFVAEIDNHADSSVAVDPANNNVYIYQKETDAVAEYDSAGSLLATFGEGVARYRVGTLAVAAASEKIYTMFYYDDHAYAFGPGVTVPNVSIGAPTEVEETSATVHGEVDPAGGGSVTSCEFEYIAEAEYKQYAEDPFAGGQSAPCAPATPYNAPTAASAVIDLLLLPSTTYHVRIAATNGNGVKSYSEGVTFQTLGPPTVEEESVTATRFNAKLEGKIDPHGVDTHYQFEYVDSQHYEAEGGFASSATKSVPISAGDIGSSQVAQQVSQEIEGLTVHTTYHYRIVASNADGTAEGSDQTFETSPVVQVEDQLSSPRIHNAIVSVEVNPLGLATSCQVQYVDEAQYKEAGYANATTLPCMPANLGSGSSLVKAEAKFTGLALDAEYHYRFILHNTSGTIETPDEAFSTFGIESFSMAAVNEKGEPETTAGAHPYELVTSVFMNKGASGSQPDVIAKEILSMLPPGLIGNPTAAARCTMTTIEEQKCVSGAAVGSLEVYYSQNGYNPAGATIYNAVPPRGKAAAFGAYINSTFDAFIEAGIRTGDNYAVEAGSQNITAFGEVWGVVIHLWGVPARHNGSGAPEKPFLRMPTSCAGPLSAEVQTNGYEEPNEVVHGSSQMPALTSCDQLQFAPTITARPTSKVADSPTGLEVDLHVPQNEGPDGVATPDLRDAVVKLPRGLTINPSSAAGLEGCTPAQFGLTTAVGVTPIHTTAGPAECPDASKIGTVEVDTPLLDHPLPGAVYVAEPYQNPFSSLLAIYIAVHDPQSGVVLKLAGHVETGEDGQITTSFNENPQLPFEDFKLKLFSGPRAVLKTPATCGTYTSTSTLTPWSAPESGPPATPSDSYSISEEPGGGACPTSASGQANSPSFEAGTQSPVAGGFSPFVLHLAREDGSQQFQSISLNLPPGLSGRLAGTPYCPESALAAAAAKSGTEEQQSPSCPQASEVGTVTVGAGAGSSPYYVTGKAYLAGPYKGAPFSIAIVTPAVAGPYDLGTVVVRSTLQIDPRTAQVTVKSDPIPTELKGIPLDIRSIAVKIGRPGFTFNPTNCEATSVGGSETSALGSTAQLADHFQVGGCRALSFKPTFTASTAAKTSKRFGASLHVSLAFPQGGIGKGANVKYVKVELPKALPARQETLNKACVVKVFEENPAECPSASKIGYAKAITPILPVPLTGSAYFVSYGGAQFPELVIVLQGDGVTIDLHGKTFIAAKTNVISSTFAAVPDQPVESFELTLPEGSYSALAANKNLCRATLQMPTTMIGQNGVSFEQKTTIGVSGCKPEIHVNGHKGKGAHENIDVTVPSAGTLTATGSGIVRAVKHARGAGTITIGVTLSRHDRHVLESNPHERVNAKVKLRFVPKHGAPLTTHVKLLIG